MNSPKVVFIDMDNTLAETVTCKDVKFQTGLYLTKRPIQIMIDAILTLYPQPKVIITKVQGGEAGIEEKLQWLKQHFEPKTFVDLIFLLDHEPYYYKGVYIDKWLQQHNIPNEDALIIDDSKQVLQYCDAYGIQTKYPQQIICDYEEYLKGLQASIIHIK